MNQAIRQALSAIETEALITELLDECVHDVASCLGSSVNNAGVDRQIDFLVTSLGR